MCLFSGKYLPLYWEHQRYIYAFILIYISPFLFGTTKIYLCVYSHLHISLFTGDNKDIFMCLFSPAYLPLYWGQQKYIYTFILNYISPSLFGTFGYIYVFILAYFLFSFLLGTPQIYLCVYFYQDCLSTLKVHIRGYVFVHVFSTYTSPIYSIHQRTYTFV